MQIDALYVKLLKIFVAVVEAKGVSNAQGPLNKDSSTISRNLTQLEVRLGIKLCLRGRQGFVLTEEGQRVYQEACQLFSAWRHFEARVEPMRHGKAGRLAISIIDNLIADPACPLKAVLQALTHRYGESLDLDLFVQTPADMEQALLERRVDGYGYFRATLARARLCARLS